MGVQNEASKDERGRYVRLPTFSTISSSAEWNQRRRCWYFSILMTVLLLLVSSFIYVTHTDELTVVGRAEYYSFETYLNLDKDCESCGRTQKTYERSQDEPRDPQRLVCYYNYPSYQKDVQELLPKDIDCDLCTHILVAFASVDNCTLVLTDNMIRTITELSELKKCNPDLKIMVSVGGAGANEGFLEMVETHKTRKTFIRSLKKALTTYKLDGVDIDWEFPGVGKYYQGRYRRREPEERQRQHFTQLLHEIRMEYLNNLIPYQLSAAVAAPESIVDVAYDVDYIDRYVDFINLMSYDFHFYTRYTPFTGINAPLFPNADENFYFNSLNTNYSANMWFAKGMDRKKIVIGLPTFGHSFTLVNGNNAIPGSPAKGYGKLGHLGFVDYTDVCEFIGSDGNVKTFFDNETFSPYLTSGSEWVSYENKESVINKAKYIKDNDFGGAMIYSLNSDDFAKRCADSRFYLTRLVGNTLLDYDL